MFDFVRSHTRLLQFILVILIFPSFVFFGVQGYTSMQEGGNLKVAKVDGRPITQAEWDRAHQRESERMRRQMPGIDAKLLDTPEMKRQVLDGLLRERVLLAAAERQNLFPADERLLQKFRTDPQMAGIRNPDGSVNRDLLAAQGMTSEMFAQQLRQDMGMRQVLLSVGGTAVPVKASSEAAVGAWLERREVQVQRFDVKDYLAKVSPTDADLEAHFKAREAAFRLPEEARIEYVVLDVEALRRGLSVTEEDLRRYYTENESRYTQAEERRASHILVKAEKSMSADERKKAREKAESLLSQVRKAPGSFGELARKNSDDPGSASRGGDLDFFGRGAMVKAFEDTVFSMKAGEISNLIETEFGYHIIQMTGTRGGAKKPFEAVRAEIAVEVTRQLAQRKFAESAETFTNTVYEQSDSLQPVIDKLKLEKKSATVRRTAAPGATGPLASAKLLEAVFGNDALRNKRNTEAIDLGNSQLVSARVVEHTPERLPPLADVRDRVRASVVQEQAAAMARKEGQARLEQLKKGAGSAGLPAAVTVSRDQTQGLARPVLEAALQAAPSGLPATLGVDLGPQGFAVVRVSKVVPREAADPAAATLGPQVVQAWAAAETETYLEALKKRFKAEVKVATAAGAASAPR